MTGSSTKATVVRVIRDFDDGEVYANVADLARRLEESGPRFEKTARRIAEIRLRLEAGLDGTRRPRGGGLSDA